MKLVTCQKVSQQQLLQGINAPACVQGYTVHTIEYKVFVYNIFVHKSYKALNIETST